MKIVFPATFKPAPGKLAEAEIHFGPEDAFLSGTKIVGFTIWTKRESPDGSEVGTSYRFPDLSLTFPSRPWKSPTGMRSYALLRAQDGTGLSKAELMKPIWGLRETILEQWIEATGYEAPGNFDEFTD